MIIQSHTIPRGQVALAIGTAAADAKTFELVCEFGSPTNGTCSNPLLKIASRQQLFHHTDRNTLHKSAAATPNWLMRKHGTT